MRRTRRLTKKNMLGLFLFLAVLMILAALFFIRPSVRAEEEERNAVYTLVTVRQGDSLWSLAQEYAPEDTDIRDYIDLLCRVNNLKSSDSIRSGSRLIIVSYE
ncbi:MAG: LysM peptidoglycan-binding domain-containing protein [Lachnospiraceae bacterium]|nr:LysM peptidoglycan-binding domain-containing protein [Lachnospiraceae bacterium]